MNNLRQSDSIPYGVKYFANAGFASLMGDLSLLLNAQGVVVKAHVNDAALAELVADTWVDQNLADLVTEESRESVVALLDAANAKSAEHDTQEEVVWEDISLPLPDDTLLPLRFGLLIQAAEENYLAVGRDMRAIAGLRQQLLNAQLTVEQDYWRLRMVETRYRSLFQMVADGLVVIDDDTGRVLESNAAANKMLAGDGNKLVGKKFPCGFDDKTTQKIDAFIEQVRGSGRGELADVIIEDSAQTVTISASMLRQAEEARLLLRISTDAESADAAKLSAHGSGPTLGDHLLDAPDAVILTDTNGRVVSTNNAFVALSELSSIDQAIGRGIWSWVGKTSVETKVLISNLKRHRTVKLFTTHIRGEFDSVSEVEISASQTSISGNDYFILLIRDVSRRLSDESEEASKLPSSVAQITDQIGKVPLKDLVKESTSIIEKLCIESALKITGDNRASAAELLGLSRQSLYAKLRQYELGNLSK